jgi:hypothetical protein
MGLIQSPGLKFSVAAIGLVTRNVINRFVPKTLSNFIFLIPTASLVLSPIFKACILVAGYVKNIDLLIEAILKNHDLSLL